MIIRIIVHKFWVPLTSSRSLMFICQIVADRVATDRNQTGVDPTDLRPIAASVAAVNFLSKPSVVPIVGYWDRSQPTGIGRKIGLSTRRPWDHLLVSVSVLLVSVSTILVSVAMTRDQSQVIVHSQNDWNRSWFRSHRTWSRSQRPETGHMVICQPVTLEPILVPISKTLVSVADVRSVAKLLVSVPELKNV